MKNHIITNYDLIIEKNRLEKKLFFVTDVLKILNFLPNHLFIVKKLEKNKRDILVDYLTLSVYLEKNSVED